MGIVKSGRATDLDRLEEGYIDSFGTVPMGLSYTDGGRSLIFGLGRLPCFSLRPVSFFYVSVLVLSCVIVSNI